MKHVLLVEDDPVISQTLVMSLPYRGYEIDSVASLSAGWKRLSEGKYDMILLDIQLPDGNGFELCRRLREKDSVVPILMVTARTDEPSAVRALSMGADDYIRKPFGLDELTARMDRMVERKPNRSSWLTYRNIRINRPERIVWVDDAELSLGRKEFEILALLVKRGGEVVTREEILDALSDQSEMYDRTIDSHLSHLRKKIREIADNRIQIQPVYGVGYRLEA